VSAIQEPPVVPDVRPLEPSEPDVTATLDQLSREVHRQGRQIKSSQQAFSIFAVLAFLIAMATLLAVAFKLDRSPKTVAQRVTASAPAPAAPLPRNVDVTLAQFAVTPSVTRAAAGHVTFRVHNAGSITHEFVVIKTQRAAADLPLTKGRADEAGNVGETGDLTPGLTKSVALKLAPGHYALICNLPGHYLAGQHTDLTVR
jgi:uncharacterized cupredoxin-like copper-binding protein